MTGVSSWISALGGIKDVLVNGSQIVGAYSAVEVVGAGITGAADTVNKRYTITIPTSGGGSATAAVVDHVSTSNRTLSGTGGLEGGQVGDRVLVTGQTNKVENGVYIVAASAWSRDPLFDAQGELTPGALFVQITSPGDIAADWWYLGNATAPDPGTDQIYFFRLAPAEDMRFLALSDTPADYTGDADKLLVVNAAEDAVEFRPNTQLGDTDTLRYIPETSDGSGGTISGSIVLTSGTTQLDPDTPTSLQSSVVFGAGALAALTGGGDGSTAIGAGAGGALTSGGVNTYLGASAGYQHQTGTGCVFIGPLTTSNANVNNLLNICNQIYSDLSGGKTRIGGSDMSAQDAVLAAVAGASTDPIIELIGGGTVGPALYARNGSPDGVVSARCGSLCLDYSLGTPKLWQNNSASNPGTSWVQFGVSTQTLPKGHLDLSSPPAVTRDTDQWTVPAGEARDATNVVDIAWGSTLNGNVTSNGVGPGGLDTGTMAAGKTYAIYVIDDGSTPATVLSLDHTSPSFADAAFTGYTHYRKVGYARTKDSAANFLQVYITGAGRAWQYRYAGLASDRAILSSGAQTSLTPIDVSDYFPANTSAFLHASYDNPNGGSLIMGQVGNPATALTLQCATDKRDFVGPFSRGGGSINYRFTTTGGTANIYAWGFDVTL